MGRMPSSAVTADRDRNDFIDILRAIAILGVFLFHALGIAYRYYELPWTVSGFRNFGVDASFLALLPASA
jgi:peptidoglycan/LPS O-acetylase OafA/YrhL